MKLISEILAYFSIYSGMYVMFYGYNSTMENRRKTDFMCLLIIGIVTFLTLIANNFTGAISRLIITIISLTIGYYIIFKERIDIVLFKSVIMFLLLNLCDIFAASLYILFPFNSSSNLLMENITYFRTLNTILVALILLLLFLIRPFKDLLYKLFNYVKIKLSYIFLIVSSLACIIFWILTYLNSFILDIEALIFTTLLIIFLLILCVIMIFQYFKNKHNEEEQKSLLNLMNEYEIILDKDRINRHEMLNNLVVLKSFKDKSSKDFEDLLDNIIKIYEDKKSKVYSNLYKLPSGIKGVVYYKMNRIKENDINLNLLISKDVEDKFENLNKKLYFNVCKILGIVLDNAIEATSVTKDKILLVDIYLDNNDLVIYVENNFVNNVDLNIIYNKGVSTKGKNRGLGLYLVKNIVSNTDLLSFNQSINNDRFITILKIKSPSI